MRRLARALLHRFADALAPPWCLGCAERLAGERAPLLLCRRCRGKLKPLDPHRHCRRCLRPLAGSARAAPLCLGCAATAPALDRLVAAWWYEPPLREVIRALKFGRLEPLAEPLVAEAVARGVPAELEAIDVVVPVPLALPRRLARGFNQAESLARPLARLLRRPLVDGLIRRDLLPRRQASLGRAARRSNLEHRLGVRTAAAPSLADRSVLLVDDVVTTGATLAAAALALRRAGAGSVSGFTVAATPDLRLRSRFGVA